MSEWRVDGSLCEEPVAAQSLQPLAGAPGNPMAVTLSPCPHSSRAPAALTPSDWVSQLKWGVGPVHWAHSPVFSDR